MRNVTVFYTKVDQELSLADWQRYLQLLPPDQLERNGRYHRWQDRHAHLLGRLLLLHGLQMYGLGSNPLNQIQYDAHRRPHIAGNIDFNISHSGNYVVCAIGTKVKLGVDIEKNNEIGFKDYENTMNATQWADIYNAPVPINTFFRYWAMKEAIIKADGRGLLVSLPSIKIDGRTAYIENSFWYLYELNIDPNYHAYLACDNNAVNVHVEVCYF